MMIPACTSSAWPEGGLASAQGGCIHTPEKERALASFGSQRGRVPGKMRECVVKPSKMFTAVTKSSSRM